MWFKLAAANFSAKNLGKMADISNSYSINYNISGFAKTTAPTSVIKGETISEITLTLQENYEMDSTATLSYGSTSVNATVSGSTYKWTNITPTGSVTITAKATWVGTGEEPVTPPTGGGDSITTWTSINGTLRSSSMITDAGYASSTSGVVYDFTGYDWSNYDIRVTCRYGTNTAMYAGGFWDASGNFLGGLWQSAGSSQIFTAKEVTDADLPDGVSWSDIATISLCASSNASNGLQVPVLEIISKDANNTPEPIIAEGTDVSGKMPQAAGYETSSSGHVMEYSGYNWADYDIYVSCRYGTTQEMYAACVWGANDTYLGGIWQSTGTAKVFEEELLEESDLPSGVTWADVEKIGLAWSSGKNTPAMKLIPKA